MGRRLGINLGKRYNYNRNGRVHYGITAGELSGRKIYLVYIFRAVTIGILKSSETHTYNEQCINNLKKVRRYLREREQFAKRDNINVRKNVSDRHYPWEKLK